MAIGAKLEGGGYPPIGVVVIAPQSLPANLPRPGHGVSVQYAHLAIACGFRCGRHTRRARAPNHIGTQLTLLRPGLEGQGTVDRRHGLQKEVPGEVSEAETVHALGLSRLAAMPPKHDTAF